MDDPEDTNPPPGVTPNKPQDPKVYGGQWGDSGKPKPSNPPPDRPERIESPPDKDDVAQPSPTAPPSMP